MSTLKYSHEQLVTLAKLTPADMAEIQQRRQPYWLIDDLSTDAEGVPNMRTPLIFIPGIMGSKLNNHKGEIWPNATELFKDLDDDSLFVLRLQADGVTALEPENQDYSTTRAPYSNRRRS